MFCSTVLSVGKCSQSIHLCVTDNNFLTCRVHKLTLNPRYGLRHSLQWKSYKTGKGKPTNKQKWKQKKKNENRTIRSGHEYKVTKSTLKTGLAIPFLKSALLVTSIWLVATPCCQFLKLKKEQLQLRFFPPSLSHPKSCWFGLLNICFKAHSFYIVSSHVTVQACIICWPNHCKLPTMFLSSCSLDP